MKKIFFIILIPLLNISCFDTCVDLGYTFKSMNVTSYFADNDDLQIFVDFEAIKGLPFEYFSKSKILHSKEIDSVYFVSNTRMIVEISTRELSEEMPKTDLEIILEMPDRKDYIDCSRSSKYIYYNNINFSIKKVTYTVYETKIIDWTESPIKDSF